MRVLMISLVLSTGLPMLSPSATARARQAVLQPPTPLIIDAKELDKLTTSERSRALEEAKRSPDREVRTYVVGTEPHLNILLIDPAAEKNSFILPDFVSDQIRALFTLKLAEPGHLGEKLMCRCTGVSFDGSRHFLVRSATLNWR